MNTRTRGPSLPMAFAVGLLTSMPMVSLGYLGSRAGWPYLPYDLFAWMTRRLPGAVITIGIDAMVAMITALGVGPTSVAAKAAEKALAIGTFVTGSGVLGVLATLARRKTGRSAVLLGLLAGFAWVVGAAMTQPLAELASGGGVWTLVLCLAWGAALGAALARTERVGDSARREVAARRQFLWKMTGLSLAASAVLAAAASLIGRRRAGAETRAGGGPSPAPLPSNPVETSGPAASPPASVLATRTAPVAGTRPEITPNNRFYRIDINLEPPRIDPSAWRLRIDGLVDAPLVLTLDELRAMPSQSQVITLECISNRLGGDLISTSLWTGVRLSAVLRRARVRAEAKAVDIEAADGFYESVGMDDADDDRTLLVYAMNGEPLAPEHGFPLRIYVPNRHGMKLPKWIERLRVSDRPGRGYWVDRGWSKEAIPSTTSVIDTVGMSMMVGQASILPVGGIAYAGARGISRVDVQVDDGPWVEAQLITPAVSPLTWALWRYDWPYVAGKHTIRVRAYDGRGELQPTEERAPHPNGASGIHEINVRV